MVLKIKPISPFLEKKNNFFNFFNINTYLSLFVIGGNSKSFKKIYIKCIYFYKFSNILINKNLSRSFDFTILFENFLYKKDFPLFFSSSSSITYENHRKRYIEKINFSIIRLNRIPIFLLKFCKYFFFKNVWKKNVKSFYFFNLASKDSVIYKVYLELVYKFVLTNTKREK